MSKLLAIRQQLNLTQEELFEKSGISVRTIQRIEAGTKPTGYTLKALAKALTISETDLLDDQEDSTPHPAAEHEETDLKWVKIINLLALPFMFLPPLNIAAPLLVMVTRKQFTPLTRNLVSIQILWTLAGLLLFLVIIALNDWFAIRSKFMMLIPVVWLLFNMYVILRNALEISRHKTLRIFKNFNIL